MTNANIIITDLDLHNWIVPMQKGDKELDLVEEMFYIACEVTPYDRNWQAYMRAFGKALFSYHEVEFYHVRRVAERQYEIVMLEG
jgi:hypothetical protein